MEKLSKRQEKIVQIIQEQGEVSNREIVSYMHGISRVTILRDLEMLLKTKLIQRIGKGRSVKYRQITIRPEFRYLNVAEYFRKEPDARNLISKRFSKNCFTAVEELFSQDELKDLHEKNTAHQKRIKARSNEERQKEYERLTIELSWKSSLIEGNTYSLIDTEILIKQNKEAKGHKREEAMMILNHKAAFDYILAQPSTFRQLTLHKIRSIHDLLMQGLVHERGLRSKPVGIVGTQYEPLDNMHQIQDAMDMFVRVINRQKDPFSKSLASILLLSYIQPFIDGNKRTARMLGNALLLAYEVCPLSYRSVDEATYKKATLLFYEQHNVRLFKELFEEQFSFAVSKYFL